MKRFLTVAKEIREDIRKESYWKIIYDKDEFKYYVKEMRSSATDVDFGISFANPLGDYYQIDYFDFDRDDDWDDL